MKIAVVGGGSWGTALAWLLAERGHRIALWAYEAEVVSAINKRRENPAYLPGVSLPDTLSADVSMARVLAHAKWVLFAVPSHVAREVLMEMYPLLPPGIPVISATKGIERERLILISDVIAEVLKRAAGERIAVLSGPSFAKELVQSCPTAVSLACRDLRLAARIQTAFATPFFRLFLTTDLVGVQLGGALKNVIALAAGVADGLGLGYNAKAVLMTRGLAEIVRLGVAMGADGPTFYGLSGMGDLFLTCSGGHSRNRRVGELIGKGESLAAIQRSMRMVAEGIRTTESAHALARKYRVDMPIVREIHRVLFEGKPPRKAVMDLMEMARGEEIPLPVKVALTPSS